MLARLPEGNSSRVIHDIPIAREDSEARRAAPEARQRWIGGDEGSPKWEWLRYSYWKRSIYSD